MSNIRSEFVKDVLVEFERKRLKFTLYQAMGMTLQESFRLLTSAELALATAEMLKKIERDGIASRG